MAGGQVSVPSAAGTVRAKQRAVVYVKSTWAEEWVLQSKMTAISASLSAAPSISKARFNLVYGENLREKKTSFQFEEFDNFDNWYVQIRLATETGNAAIWTGIFVHRDEDIFGADGVHPAGVRGLSAYGLEHVLDRKGLSGAWAEQTDGGSVVEIGWMPKFNMSKGYGSRIVGNRSTNPTGSNDVYVFGKASQTWDHDGDNGKGKWIPPTGTHVWTHKQILDYLFEYYQPEGGPTYKLVGQLDDLEKIVTIVDLANLNFKQALDKLISRQRGFEYVVRPDPGTGDVNVIVSTVVGKDISAGNITLSANENIFPFDVSNNIDFNPVVVRQNYAAKYQRVRVKGARVKSCFTIYFGNGTLEKGWTDAEETAYKEDVDSDLDRGDDRHDRVYSLLRIPPDFNWKTNKAPEVAARNIIVNPKADDHGKIDMNVQGAYYNADKSFLNKLPLKIRSTKSGTEPVYRAPLVLVQDPKEADAYYHAEAVQRKGDKINVSMVDREMAIRLKIRPNHYLALNHFDADLYSPRTKDPPEYDYDNVIATVFCETDEQFRVVEDIPVEPKPDVIKELVITDESCELWFIAPWTVIGIQEPDAWENGLLYYNDEYYLPKRLTTFVGNEYEAEPYLLRDDSDRLRAIAAFVKAWYGTPRATVSITLQTLSAADYVGKFLSTITSGRRVEFVNTPVTEVSWDFTGGNMTTTIQTGFVELDLRGFFGRGNVPGMSDARSVGKTFAKLQKEVAELQERVGGLPARFTENPLQLISDDKHVEDSLPDHSTVIRRQNDARGGGLWSMVVVRARPGEISNAPGEKLTTYVPNDAEAEEKYSLMLHVNDSFVEGLMGEGTMPANKNGGASGNYGWFICPGDPNEGKFRRTDKAVIPGKLAQIGDVLTMPVSNLIGKTPDLDSFVKYCIRHDAIFYHDAQHDGRIYFVLTDLTNEMEYAGPIIKGAMGFDIGLANSNTGHGPHESVQWRPYIRWPVAEYTGGDITLSGGDVLHMSAWGTITGSTPAVP